jgi:hypothetical protein
VKTGVPEQVHKGARPEQVFGGDGRKGSWVSYWGPRTPNGGCKDTLGKSTIAKIVLCRGQSVVLFTGAWSSLDYHSLATPVQSPLDPAHFVILILLIELSKHARLGANAPLF